MGNHETKRRPGVQGEVGREMRAITDHIVSGDQAVQLEIAVTDQPGAGGANHRYELAAERRRQSGYASPLKGKPWPEARRAAQQKGKAS